MDTRTTELFQYLNQGELEEASKKNPYLVEVNCIVECEFREERKGRFFCVANRKQRRKIKCQEKREGGINERK